MDLYLHVGFFEKELGKRVKLGFRGRLMELYLQFGYGMMDHCRSLISDWGGGTVILSPRDLTSDQLRRIATDITRLPNGQVMLDPQFYLPHSDHERLCSHDYWPDSYSTSTFFGGPHLNLLLREVLSLNRQLRASKFILPGLHAGSVDLDWLTIQGIILDEARNLNSGLPLCQTIALSSDATRSIDQISMLLEHVARHPADAYYLVCEHPGGNYLVDDAIWLANVLDLTAGLRMTGADVIIGYCNHQMLVAASAKATAIASGTWMNVRSFPPEKFRGVYDEEVKQRATWYYCPQALSEYKIPFLDIAQRVSLLDLMAPPPRMKNAYVARLFNGEQPSTARLSEQSAFRHYLHCLRIQSLEASLPTFAETFSRCNVQLDSAEETLSSLASAGIRGQKRDFTDIVDTNRAAIGLLERTRGPLLRRRWSSL